MYVVPVPVLRVVLVYMYTTCCTFIHYIYLQLQVYLVSGIRGTYMYTCFEIINNFLLNMLYMYLCMLYVCSMYECMNVCMCGHIHVYILHVLTLDTTYIHTYMYVANVATYSFI